MKFIINDLVITNVYNERVFVVSRVNQINGRCLIYDYRTKENMGEWHDERLTKIKPNDYPEYFI